MASEDHSAFNARAFRQCLGQFSTGVTVITAAVDGDLVGVTANSFSSLSLDPPMVLWSIARTSRSFAAFSRAKAFAVNVLADDQVPESQRFSSKEVGKFAGVAWHPGENASPIIDGSAAEFECTTHAMHDGGDHLLIVGRVSRYAANDRNVLIFSQGRYKIGVDHPVLRTTAGGPQANQERGQDSFGTVLLKAHIGWSEGFDHHRNALNLTVGKGRVLYALSTTDRLGADDLSKRISLPRRVLDDEISDLVASGDLEWVSPSELALTRSGRSRRKAMRSAISEYEASLLREVSPHDLEITRRTLTSLLDRTSR